MSITNILPYYTIHWTMQRVKGTTPGSHGHAQHRSVEVLGSSSKEVISRDIVHVRNKAQL